jgi:hypothetical protein
MAKQTPKKPKREPASPPRGATSEPGVQPTAPSPLFPDQPLSPESPLFSQSATSSAESPRSKGMNRMDLLQFYSLMDSFGITDRNFLSPLFSQLIEADGFGGDGVEFAAAVIKNVHPRDSLEAMLAAQMAVVHWEAMRSMRQVGRVRGTEFEALAVTTTTKMMRLFGTQMETLKRYRSGGEQKVTVRHELVSEQGEAIVRSITHTKSHRNALKNSVGETPALSHSRQVEMPVPGDLAYEQQAWLEYEARKKSSS